MDLAAAFLGLLTALLGVILAFVALWNKIRNGIKSVVTEVMVDSGLIKAGRKEQIWPNGSDTLPDFLKGLYEDVKDLKRMNGGE